MSLLFVLGASAVALFIGGAIARDRRRTQQRGADLTAIAERMGWRYHADADLKALPDLKRFELFRTGSSRKLRHLLTSPPGDKRAVVFDYLYTVSSGKSSHTYRQTVFYATGEALTLPTFSLRPENFFHRVGAMFGYQDIDLERRPEFSRLFLLRGEKESAIREAFNSEVVDFFEARPGVCAAGMGRELLYWRTGRLAQPDEVEQLVAEGYDLARRFAGVQREM